MTLATETNKATALEIRDAVRAAGVACKCLARTVRVQGSGGRSSQNDTTYTVVTA